MAPEREATGVRVTNRAGGVDAAAALRRWVSGRVTGPRDAGWERAQQAWNRLVDQAPAAVVEVASVADVRATVRIAADLGASVTMQPRGHGATAALRGTILLRPGRLSGFAIDSRRRVARVEPGVRWFQLNAALAGTELTGLPGSTGDVAVIPYHLGGGLSWFGRRHGLAANRVCAAEVVTPEGAWARVTDEDDPDLFWALRGGGGDFGVVTALEVELVPMSRLVGGRLAWSIEHVEAVLTAFAEAAAVAPDELAVWAGLLNLPDVDTVPEPLRGRWTVTVDLTCLGDSAPAEAVIRALRAVAPPVLDTLGPVALARIGEITAEPTEPTPLLDIAPMLRDFDRSTIQALLDAVMPGSPSPLSVIQVRRLGGALARPPADHGALGHIADPFLLVAGAVVPEPGLAATTHEQLDTLERAMTPFATGRTAPNLGRDPERLHPPEVLTRLREIKTRRDPHRVIRSNQPVLGS